MVHSVCCVMLTEPDGPGAVVEEVELTEWSKYLAGVEERMKDGIVLYSIFVTNYSVQLTIVSDIIMKLYTMYSESRHLF